MVVVSWTGFGIQATTWGGQTMKAHLSAPIGSRNAVQSLPSCSSCKSTAVGNVHTYLQKALEAESSSAGLSTRLVIRSQARWTTPLPGACAQLTDAVQ